MKHNSTENQNIKGKFVRLHVIHLATPLITELQNTELCMDDILEEFYSTPDYDTALENYYYELSKVQRGMLIKEYDVTDYSELNPEQVCNDKDLEPEILEPLEFWIVSDYLGNKLKEKGEIVSNDFMGFTIWGRCASGQAILLDGVITEICSDMEILHGQKNQW